MYNFKNVNVKIDPHRWYTYITITDADNGEVVEDLVAIVSAGDGMYIETREEYDEAVAIGDLW